MAKKIKLEMTEAQFQAILNIADEMDAMMGNGEDEEIIRIRWLRLVDRMLVKNGHEKRWANRV